MDTFSEHPYRPKVLIVDDEASIIKTMSICLEELNLDITSFTNPLDALEDAQNTVYDLAFIDLKMSPLDGLKLLEELKQLQEHLTIIIITAHGSVESAVSAVKKGAFDYLQKPFDYLELQLLTQRVVEYHLLKREVKDLRQQLNKQIKDTSIITRNPQMKEMVNLARRAAETDLTVLIAGESGTGKELFANLIHHKSQRAQKPFIKINCAALPENLLESELFGHIKGAYTGALKDRKGRFEEADGGTLFLDEIAEMSPSVQAKLLRVLQDREFQRLGENVSRKADVRIIAATNKNLDQAMREGSFREDLYYRLNTLNLNIPPLRERPDDILVLSEYFIQKYNPEKTLTITPEVRSALLAYRWSGNVRELENVIQRAALLSTSDLVQLKDLPAEVQMEEDSNAIMLSLEEVERQHIKKILNICRDLNEAANILGIDPSTLWRKRQKYRL